jgi:hypothetical protein
MTSTSAVGVGLVRPMGKPVRTDADLFYKRYSRASAAALAHALKEFTKAREYSEQDSQLLQGILIQDYGLLGLAQRIMYG